MSAQSSTPRILVVEDDASVREALAEFLHRHGLAVATAANGIEADRRLGAARFDLVVLDLMMPGEDGLSICRRLAGSGPPVLMMSALGDTSDRIVGLEIGAADYLAKPFEPRELLARIRAVLRRTREAAPERGRLSFAGLTWDAERSLLSDAAGAPVSLTAGELRLLEAFVTRPGRLLTRDFLMDVLHGPEAGPYDRAIDLSVSRLRRKLAAVAEAACLETVRGAGYRFVAPVAP